MAMRLLFDASALFKRYRPEAGTAQVQQAFAAASEVLIAAHCKAEVAAALYRWSHDGVCDVTEIDGVLAEVHADFLEFTLVPLNERSESLALACMRRNRLRAMDALHVGAAISAGADGLVTADRKQAAAAQSMGVTVTLIEA